MLMTLFGCVLASYKVIWCGSHAILISDYDYEHYSYSYFFSCFVHMHMPLVAGGGKLQASSLSTTLLFPLLLFFSLLQLNLIHFYTLPTITLFPPLTKSQVESEEFADYSYDYRYRNLLVTCG